MTSNTATAAGLPADTALQRARRHFRGDWDANGTTSVHLPRNVAWAFLMNLGWERHECPPARRDAGTAGYWTAPGSSERIWETDEAMQLAIAGQVL